MHSLSIQNETDRLLSHIKDGSPMTLSQRLSLTLRLSFPAILAQLSSIVMQYIDAAMVGSLGAEASASIGLVASTTWLFSGLCSAVVAGFAVQVAHLLGAGENKSARSVLRQSITSTLIFSTVLAFIGVSISAKLPVWLGADPSIHEGSALYFRVYSLFLPVLQMNFLASGMLRYSGNMRIPSAAGVLMCLLDVIFNFFLIFPTREMHVFGSQVLIPGAGLGIEGAVIGTGLAQMVVAALLSWFLFTRGRELRLSGEWGSYSPTSKVIKRAVQIGLPMGLEHMMICGAQIMTMVIVAPLGVFAIAANSFAVTAESLCYMPGYGIADAAATLVGQSLGAKRVRLAKSFAYLTVGTGMVVMTFMGVLMYLFAPQIIGIMTPVEQIRDLGAEVLRIEAFAEPMFAASIVAYSVFVGAVDTLVPCLMNLLSIWGVRLTLAAVLAPKLGLRGVWIAMCIELCFRGIIFLVRLFRKRWLRRYESV